MPIDPKAIVLIPARWASSRFPGKPLAQILDKPMIQWVVENARRAENVSDVIVATDDSRILEVVHGFGGQAVMTGNDHLSGSDRIAEVAAGLDCDMIINVQGDEPMIPPKNIEKVIQGLIDNPTIPVSTLMMPIDSSDELFDPDIVKVVSDAKGRALYFSRAPVPWNRDEWVDETMEHPGSWRGHQSLAGIYKHIGIYGYRRSFLLDFTRMEPTPLETLEKLEQLRILENGFSIKVEETDGKSIGVDRVEDIEKIEILLSKENQPSMGS